MERIVIYHGSETIIEKPIYGYGKTSNDYGLAFYCTTSLEMAKEWASRTNASGFANKYSFNATGLKVLDLTDPSFNVLNWIAILMHFRELSLSQKTLYKRRLEFLEKNFYVDVTKYDVVIGYRADDAYFKFPLFFLQNELSIESLENIYKAGDLGKQIALISEKSFSRLSFVKAIKVERVYKEKYYTRKSLADSRFEEIRINDVNNTNDKLEDLMKNYDKR